MIGYIIKYHLEWLVLLGGLLLLGMMNPYIDNGSSLCLLDAAGFPYCPGDGLGHSIAFTLRGDLSNAIAAHPIGPAAILILASRIGQLLHRAYQNTNFTKYQNQYQ